MSNARLSSMHMLLWGVLIAEQLSGQVAESVADDVKSEWQNIGPGIDAGPLDRSVWEPGDTRLTSNEKVFYERLANIAKQITRPQQYAKHHPEMRRSPIPPGLPPNFRIPKAPPGSIGLGARVWGSATGSSFATPMKHIGVTTGGMQDIGLAREMIREDRIPYSSTFTLEGLLAEHDIPLGAVPGDRGFLYPSAAFAYVTRYGHSSPEAVLQIGFGVDLPEGEFKRPPLNLAIVVDCSGSMSGAKIASARAAVQKIVGQLQETDRVALVCFDNTVWVPVVSTDLNAEARRALEKAIQADIGAWGGTNLEAALRAGFEQVAAHLEETRDAKQHSRVVLLTDARPNINVTDPDGFLSLIRGAAGHGIGITAFGVGLDFGQDLAYRIMQVPGANYRFLENADKLRKVFDEEFPFVVTPVAYDVEVLVTPASGVAVTDALGVPDFLQQESLRNPDVRLTIPTLFFSARSGGGATAVAMSVPSNYGCWRRRAGDCAAAVSIGGPIRGAGKEHEV